MEGGGVPGAQEEEHTRKILLVPGEVLRDHAGRTQLLKVRGPAGPVIKVIRIEHGGVAVIHVDRHGAAKAAFYIPGNGPQTLLQAEKYFILECPEGTGQVGMTGDSVTDGAAGEFTEF